MFCLSHWGWGNLLYSSRILIQTGTISRSERMSRRKWCIWTQRRRAVCLERAVTFSHGTLPKPGKPAVEGVKGRNTLTFLFSRPMLSQARVDQTELKVRGSGSPVDVVQVVQWAASKEVERGHRRHNRRSLQSIQRPCLMSMLFMIWPQLN